ncbi:MAG: Xaa-Pro dipeptidase [Gammaproteobacteria bacterium]|nr:Xaa-Pro dipeptidase [Gammaproteobacteria bacterium]
MPENLNAQLANTFGPHLAAVSARTARALEATGFSSLLVHSGSQLPVFEDDQHYPYIAHAPFKVWAPLGDAPDSFVYFEPGLRPRLILNQPRDYWHQPPALPSGYWADAFDVRVVHERGDARAELPKNLADSAYIGDRIAELGAWGLRAVNPPPLMRRLDYVRAVKTPYEILCLREASRTGALGHRAARAAFFADASEFEIELAFLAACGQRERELPYNPIIALNTAAAVLHYQLLERQRPAERHSMLIDAGTAFAGYASDITRTYSREDPDFGRLIERLDGLQRRLTHEVHPGLDWRALHLRCHELLAELLREADLVLCGAEEALARGLTRLFLPHGLGHLLGLEVHDVGARLASPDGAEEIPRPKADPALRLTRVLEPGFVVTMEPGLYFIDALLTPAREDERSSLINWTRVAQFSRFGGIRIEDDLLVTESGCDNLTREAFAALA